MFFSYAFHISFSMHTVSFPSQLGRHRRRLPRCRSANWSPPMVWNCPGFLGVDRCDGADATVGWNVAKNADPNGGQLRCIFPFSSLGCPSRKYDDFIWQKRENSTMDSSIFNHRTLWFDDDAKIGHIWCYFDLTTERWTARIETKKLVDDDGLYMFICQYIEHIYKMSSFKWLLCEGSHCSQSFWANDQWCPSHRLGRQPSIR